MCLAWNTGRFNHPAGPRLIGLRVMKMRRRELLTGTAFALAAGAIASDYSSSQGLNNIGLQDWGAIRAQFALSDEFIHMSAMLLASHPQPVREAIEEHRRGIDSNPLAYVFQKNHLLQNAARIAAGQYLGLDATNIALADSTTMGVGLVYNGLRLQPDQRSYLRTRTIT
jgi:isopenicillin-N epimerase